MFQTESIVEVDEVNGLVETYFNLAVSLARVVESHCVPELLSAYGPRRTVDAPCRVARDEDGKVAYWVLQIALFQQHDAFVVVWHRQLRNCVVATLVGGKQVYPLPARIDANLLHGSVFQFRVALYQRVRVKIDDAVVKRAVVWSDSLHAIGNGCLNIAKLLRPRQVREELVLIARH